MNYTLIIGAIADALTAIGVVLAAVMYYREARRYRRQKEADAYRELAGKYFDYLRVLLDHPTLSTTETVWAEQARGKQDRNQAIVVQMAISMMETAFYMYKDTCDEFKRSQFEGWKKYARDWCAHPALAELWDAGVVDQYDAEFVKFMRARKREADGLQEVGKHD